MFRKPIDKPKQMMYNRISIGYSNLRQQVDSKSCRGDLKDLRCLW